MYLEIAIGSPSNRGTLIPREKLKDYLATCISNKEPMFRSTYIYDDDVLEYSKANNGIKGYLGKRDIDYIILDIDKSGNTDEYTLNKARSIVYELMEEEITHICYFSGTGYHIEIPKKVFGFEASKDLPYIVKETVKQIFPDIDHSVLMRSSIYRVLFTLNKKSNLYKIQLTSEEILSLSAEEIKKAAKKPRKAKSYFQGSGELKRFKKEEVPEIRRLSEFPEPMNLVTCVQKMYHKGPQEGNRHKTLLRMASHFMRHGIPSDLAKVSLLHWNNNSLEKEEILRVVEQTYKAKYRYGCKDEVMSDFCSTKCIHFKRKDYLTEVYNSNSLQKELEKRMTTDFSGKSINLSKMFGVEKDCTLYPGELVTIFGPTGCNKTALAQNICLGYDFKNNLINNDWHVPTLFLSLELSAWYMHRRNLQIVSGKDKDYLDKNYKEAYRYYGKHLDHVVIQTISPTIEQIKLKVRELQPALVVVDYIDLVETGLKDEYGQIRKISHSLSNLAVNEDIIIIQLSQISRSYSRDEVIDLYAGKGSGAIENASRKVIGLSGRADKAIKSVEILKNSDGDLFSTKLEWTPSFRLRRYDEE